jgi:hypothetical protein
MRLNSDLREFIELFHSHKVEFVVVGAYALAFHGHPRYPGDVDLLVRTTPGNAAKIERVAVAHPDKLRIDPCTRAI